MSTKLIESVSSIAGSMLDAGTWLRGNRAVKVDLQVKSMVVEIEKE